MRLMILERVDDGAGGYRGPDRPMPGYQELFPEDIEPDPVLKEGYDTLWLEYLTDLSMARALLNAVRSTNDRYELIEVVGQGENPEVGSEFFGYDLMEEGGAHSLLDWYALPEERAVGRGSEPPQPLEPLLRLLYRRYRPLLARHGLFQELASAIECLEIMEAVQNGCVMQWEEGTGYEVVGVWAVRDDAATGT